MCVSGLAFCPLPCVRCVNRVVPSTSEASLETTDVTQLNEDDAYHIFQHMRANTIGLQCLRRVGGASLPVEDSFASCEVFRWFD